MTDRQIIIDNILQKRLIRTCAECQVVKSKTDKQWLDDLEQDLWVWVMTYDINKLSDAFENNHLNALISKVIINWLYSKTSPFHKTYREFEGMTDEITRKEENIPDGN